MSVPQSQARSPYPGLRPAHRELTSAVWREVVDSGHSLARITDGGDGWERVEIPMGDGGQVLVIQAPDEDDEQLAAWTVGIAEAEVFDDGSWEADTSTGTFATFTSRPAEWQEAIDLVIAGQPLRDM